MPLAVIRLETDASQHRKGTSIRPFLVAALVPAKIPAAFLHVCFGTTRMLLASPSTPRVGPEVAALLKGLSAAGYHVTLEDLKTLVAISVSSRGTPRFTLSSNQDGIRANWGHTIPIDSGENG